MIDYLIIGSGLAGIAFAETALQYNKSIFVVDANLHNSSKVAAGLYNPVILKRYSALANAGAQLDAMHTLYDSLQVKLGVKFKHDLAMLRKFYSIEEQNNWFAAADRPGLSDFLSTDLVYQKFSGIESPFGFGKVNRTGYVDTVGFLEAYREWLTKEKLFSNQIFDYNLLDVRESSINYRDIEAKHIVFAEGFGLHANPFFNDLPLDGTKGELLLIKAPLLSLDVLLNTNLFVLPVGNDLFKVGATYNWTDKTDTPTDSAREELVARLKEIITCDFEVIEQKAGVRPTVKDRKPLLGTHPEFDRLHIINGLGTRGVMLAPMMAKILFDYIEDKAPLPTEIDIRRFTDKD
ncbi:MAG TPA: FAD-binding oxidoreductase [Flavobacterium sp.]|nr:FAD-binding oxidoreductase [Flavobacterium sp.]